MPARELTQLEQWVADHPSVAYFKKHGLSDVLDLISVAADEEKQVSPAMIGKKWDVLSENLRAVVVMTAKVRRDRGDDPRDQQLLAGILDWMTMPEYRHLPWERDELINKIHTRRRQMGDIRVYAFPKSMGGLTGVSGRLLTACLKTLGAEDFVLSEHKYLTSPLDHVPGFDAYMFCVVDPPGGITKLLKMLQGITGKRYKPLLIRVPRTSETCAWTRSESDRGFIDLPLRNCLGALFPERFTARQCSGAARKLASLGTKVWRPRGPARFVIFADVWGGIYVTPQSVSRIIGGGLLGRSALRIS